MMGFQTRRTHEIGGTVNRGEWIGRGQAVAPAHYANAVREFLDIFAMMDFVVL
jgi:hypothetical protein